MGRFLLLLGLIAVSCAANAQGTDFRACVQNLRADASGQGISNQTFDSALKGVEPDPSVLEAMDSQPEFKTPIWDYLASLVDDQRIADGKARLEQWASVLDAAEQKFGVDPPGKVAGWGGEWVIGKKQGGRPRVG